MVRYLLPNSDFPDPAEADEYGLVAVGGQLTPKRVLAAYKKGIFPWYKRPPVLWYSLAPRMVIIPNELHVGRTLRNIMNRNIFTITVDTCFKDVIMECSKIKRLGQYGGSWINKDMVNAYVKLHQMGYAHSCEAWLDEKLVGGLYGLSLGNAFFGESMFAKENDASKIAFVTLARQLQKWNFSFIDCQQRTEHMLRFGGILWERKTFQEKLSEALKCKTKIGKWYFDGDKENEK